MGTCPFWQPKGIGTIDRLQIFLGAIVSYEKRPGGKTRLTSELLVGWTGFEPATP